MRPAVSEAAENDQTVKPTPLFNGASKMTKSPELSSARRWSSETVVKSIEKPQVNPPSPAKPVQTPEKPKEKSKEKHKEKSKDKKTQEVQSKATLRPVKTPGASSGAKTAGATEEKKKKGVDVAKKAVPVIATKPSSASTRTTAVTTPSKDPRNTTAKSTPSKTAPTKAPARMFEGRADENGVKH
jgi:hypothetical protein